VATLYLTTKAPYKGWGEGVRTIKGAQPLIALPGLRLSRSDLIRPRTRSLESHGGIIS